MNFQEHRKFIDELENAFVAKDLDKINDLYESSGQWFSNNLEEMIISLSYDVLKEANPTELTGIEKGDINIPYLWDCENKDNILGTCVYKFDSEACLFCHDPQERK